MKLFEWKRAAASLGILLVAYAIYTLAIVPWVEPPLRRRELSLPQDAAQEIRSTARFQQQLKDLFPADAWEMNQPNVLHCDGMTVLFEDYQPRDDGTVHIHPCTVVLRRDDQPTDRRLTAPLILQAPDGALLTLNRPLDLRTAQVGQPVEGRLLGRIRIHSPGTSDGRGRLNIVTSNVQIKPQHLWTPHEVLVEFGRSSARGQDLMIKLLPGQWTGSRRTQDGFAGIRSLELVRLDQLHLELESAQAPRDTPAPAGSVPTVDVTCKGPVRIDFMENVATFEDQVSLRRHEPGGADDTLRCELLSLYLEPAAAPPSASPTATAKRGKLTVPRWTVRKVVAEGDPAELHVASKKARVRGRKLLYDLQQRRFRLWASDRDPNDQVMLRQDTHQIVARALDCQLAEDRSIHQLQATGPGRFQGLVPGDSSQELLVSWQGELRLQRDADDHLLTLTQGARVQFGRDREIEAAEMQLWLEAAPRVLIGRSTTQVDLRPKRLLALTDRNQPGRRGVRIRAPEMNGQTARLEAHFQHQLPQQANATRVRPVSATAGQPQTQPGSQPRGRLRGLRSTSAPPATDPRSANLEVTGQSVEVVFRLAGRDVTVQQVALRGQAQLSQRDLRGPQAESFLLLADAVDVRDVNGQGGHQVVATGQPVQVQTDRLTLQSGQLQMDRLQNLMWTDGPGRMTLKVDQDLEGRPLPAPQSLTIDWHRQMRFDGTTIRFAGDVEVLGQLQRMRAQQLAVSLNRRVDFATTTPVRGSQLQLRKVQADGNVVMENRQIERGQLQSSSYLLVPHFYIDQQTGQAQAGGPGRLVLVRRGFSQTLTRPARSSAVAPKQDQRLTFVQIDFQRQLQGDLRRRVVDFHDRVQVLYGPVLSWNETLQTDSAVGADEILLSCKQLTLAEGPSLPDGKRSVNMAAQGNTYVEGQAFAARGDRVSYEQVKDLLVLEGTARDDAVLSHQSRIGAPRTEHAARKILYWPQTQRVEVDDARYLDLSNLGGYEWGGTNNSQGNPP